MIIRAIISILKSPLALAVICFAVAYGLIRQSHTTGGERAVQRDFKQFMGEVAQKDPMAANRLADFGEFERMGIVAAYRTVPHDSTRRNTLTEMVRQTREDGLPVRSRLVNLALGDAELRGDSLADFLAAHTMMAELLEGSTAEIASENQYLTLLEQARMQPGVWRLVKDDAFGLVLWSAIQDQELLEFYHRNREWLAEPLALIDFGQHAENEWTIAKALTRLRESEPWLKEILAEDRADLGVIGLAVMLSHAELLKAAVEGQKLNAGEVVRIIYSNPDQLSRLAGNAPGVSNMAAYLARLQSHETVVWLAAQEFLFTLKLFMDAPEIAPQILRSHGEADIAMLLYQWFETPAEIQAALKSIHAFGDMAIYVFGQWNHESTLLRQLITDPEVGVALVPFLIRYWDEGFERIEQNKNWVRKYFNPENGSVVDPNWIQYVPGGAVVNIAANFATGVPNEWGELGWAAYDVGAAALAVATWGSSASVTTAARAGGTANKAVSTASKIKRATSASRWMASVSQKAIRSSRFARSSGNLLRVAQTGKILGTTIWKGVRIVGQTAGKIIRAIPANWAKLSPQLKKIVRGTAFATALYIRLKYTTIPNMDKITDGIASWVADAVQGAGTALVDTLQKTIQEVVESSLPTGMKGPTLIAFSWGLFGLSFFLIIRSVHTHLRKKPRIA